MRLNYLLLILSLITTPLIKSNDANLIEVQNVYKEQIIEYELEEEVVELEEVEVIEEDVIEIVEEAIIEEIKVDLAYFNVNGLTLSEGKVSEEVFRVKTYLEAKGYEGINKDYYFDLKTADLVKKYKEVNGLISNGIIDKNTYEKINEDIQTNNIYIPETKLEFSKEIPKGNWIIVNKSNNTLYHLIGTRIINKYPVATGKSPQATPEGQFTIVTKYINPAWGGAGIYKPVKGGAPNNPLGKRWMGLSIRGGGVYGIHGNSDQESIGRYATLGCIRMFNEEVEIFYDLIDFGTNVWIGNETKLKEFGVSINY